MQAIFPIFRKPSRLFCLDIATFKSNFEKAITEKFCGDEKYALASTNSLFPDVNQLKIFSVEKFYTSLLFL